MTGEIERIAECPFCGGEALLENTITEASVMCCDCPATIRCRHTTRTFDDGKHYALAAWKRRAHLEQHHAKD